MAMDFGMEETFELESEVHAVQGEVMPKWQVLLGLYLLEVAKADDVRKVGWTECLIMTAGSGHAGLTFRQ